MPNIDVQIGAGAPKVASIMLNNRVTIPQLGFGVFQLDTPEVPDVIAHALKAGYRDFYCALENAANDAVCTHRLPLDEVHHKIVTDRPGLGHQLGIQ